MELRKGLKGEASVRVSRENTASALGNEGVDVFATPFMVALMEEAARNAVESQLPQGTITLGGRIDLKHLAPSPLGFEGTARAELKEIEGPKLTFEVEILDPMERVGEGVHVRFLAPQDAFLKRIHDKASAGRKSKKG
jgi:predicted thioesterase